MTVPRQTELAFLIADLSGYTALTEAHGDLEAANIVGRYVEIADSVLAPGTRRVERVGDEILVAGGDAAAVVRTAIALRDAVEREPHFPTVRCGIHAGPVAEREGSYSGAALNLTARVASHARGGQILCTAAVAEAAATVPGVRLRRLGGIRFRNVGSLVEVIEILTTDREEAKVLDPVCRMLVHPETAPAKLPWGGAIRYFCSFDCARAFAASPESYTD